MRILNYLADRDEKKDSIYSKLSLEDPFLLESLFNRGYLTKQLKKYGIFTSIGKSGYVAVLSLELCSNFGICQGTCLFEAISEEEELITIDENKCFGCGQCANNCPEKAISLVQN